MCQPIGIQVFATEIRSNLSLSEVDQLTQEKCKLPEWRRWEAVEMYISLRSIPVPILTVLWIRIRMDPERLPGYGSGIIVPDPAKYEEQINKNVISLWILDCVHCRTGRYLVGFSFWLNLRCFNFISKYRILKYVAWIRIRMDPELLSGSWTRKIQSWIRNKPFLILNTGTGISYRRQQIYFSERWNEWKWRYKVFFF